MVVLSLKALVPLGPLCRGVLEVVMPLSKDKSFYGPSKRETFMRLFVIAGVLLAYLDPVIFAAVCSGAVSPVS